MEVERGHVSETFVKKSRFVTSVGKAGSVSEAKGFISMVSEEGASHNCWAYKIDGNTYGYSDDGEPVGSAGKPIFGAICSSGVERVVVVVTRYFGGVKLGTGGLTRAYRRAAANSLEEAAKRPIVHTVDINIKVDWKRIGAVQSVVERLERVETCFASTGCTIRVRVREEQQKSVEQQLVDVCNGHVELEIDVSS